MLQHPKEKNDHLQSNENYTDSSLLWKSKIIENRF